VVVRPTLDQNPTDGFATADDGHVTQAETGEDDRLPEMRLAPGFQRITPERAQEAEGSKRLAARLRRRRS